MSDRSKKIFVYENWSSTEPVKIGILYADTIRGREQFSFEYEGAYLQNHKGNFMLDPDLSFYHGRQYITDKPNFGIFSDSCPDSWGRTLLDRKERFQARKEERKPGKLLESDYLLGIYDGSRMGALRFAIEDGGPFLSDDKEGAIPPWEALRTLEEANREFEKDSGLLDERWLKQLLYPGSSLGGARPKATVQDTAGSLWIAKFPSRHDEFNVGAWEKTAHELACICGICVPPSRLERFTGKDDTFLVKRFDRRGAKRIHFSSAMTMLGKKDGSDAADGSSYLEIAEFIRANGSRPKEDLEELWKRIVFNMTISNTDDHLRNHGFLLDKNGWRLSPAYDLNPVPYGDVLSLNVNMEDNTIDFDLAIETSAYYGIQKKQAADTVKAICSLVEKNWRRIAEKHGLQRSEIEDMSPAFLKCRQS
ncbi:MAG: HipA domain-containing protein [Lachnospiraceae bacterium]|nr:HipA domain-containing protein [Lachnospiraceae bacterium]